MLSEWTCALLFFSLKQSICIRVHLTSGFSNQIIRWMLIPGLNGPSVPQCLDADRGREYVQLRQMEAVNYRRVYHPALANYLTSQDRLCALTSPKTLNTDPNFILPSHSEPLQALYPLTCSDGVHKEGLGASFVYSVFRWNTAAA